MVMADGHHHTEDGESQREAESAAKSQVVPSSFGSKDMSRDDAAHMSPACERCDDEQDKAERSDDVVQG
jgi:hypothetical protein